jgi:hypothetical protein
MLCEFQGIVDLNAETARRALSSLVWPSRSCTARRFVVRR